MRIIARYRHVPAPPGVPASFICNATIAVDIEKLGDLSAAVIHEHSRRGVIGTPFDITVVGCDNYKKDWEEFTGAPADPKYWFRDNDEIEADLRGANLPHPKPPFWYRLLGGK